MRSPLVALLFAVVFCSFAPLASNAAVSGRYVRLEAPALGRFAIHEIEVFVDGKNVVLNNGNIRFASHVRPDGRDINYRNDRWRLIDGRIDFESPCLELHANKGLNLWVEIDLGEELPIERIRIARPKKPLYNDRALRLLSVLDSKRQVVFVAHWDIRPKPYDEGAAEFTIDPAEKVRQTIAPGVMSWAPLGELLDARELPAPSDSAERRRRFERRNSPESIEQLARAFYARLDTSKPELAEVRKLFGQQDYAGMLDAYRDHFLKKLRAVTFFALSRI